MVKAADAIATARALLGTPYSELDCISLIVRVIRTSPGGDPTYRCQGTNWLWRSIDNSARYRDLTWRQEGIQGARAGMLAFKRSGDNVHHVGLVTERGTVIHSSSAKGCVVETALDDTWQLLAIHRYIKAAGEAEESEENAVQTYNMQVVLSDEDSTLNVRNEPGKGGDRIGRLSHGAVVTVLAEFDNGWRFVTYGDGASGYVDGSFLQPVENTEDKTGGTTVTIVDSAGNRFCPVGDFRVLIGSVD
ncbi:MAG: SH3 domain-containing protein [Clostridiales bacterium]|nr:SH3 domain-containing protein [Clostridiales bacterium]MDY5514827.1 SH3 domain-containing protein [Candidatus Ventricola sp.]